MGVYELGKIRTDRGEFVDKGNYGIDPRHGDFANGAKGDGSTDDRAAFAAADSHATTLGAELCPGIGTYKIASNLTITSPVRLKSGVVIKPANGVTVTFSSDVYVDSVASLSVASGGSFAFSADASFKINGVPVLATDGLSNLFVGDNAGKNTTRGDGLVGCNNTAVGYQALFYNTVGIDNTTIGYQSLILGTGSFNTALGYRSMFHQTTASYNTAVGFDSLYENTTGQHNTVVGQHAMWKSVTADNNCAFGDSALENSLSPGNAAFGFNSLNQLVSTAGSTGNHAAFGTYSGYRVTSGNTSTFLGPLAGFDPSQKVDPVNSTAIGYNSYTTANNQVVIGNSSVLATVLRGVVSMGGVAGDALTHSVQRKSFTGIPDASAQAVLTVTVPNGAHSAMLRVTIVGSLGAGGAIGANEATGTVSYDISIARTAGVNAVASISSAYGSATSSVAGAATITVAGALSAVSGAVGASNTFNVTVTITRGSGSSTNHTAVIITDVVNANATGITVT